MERWFDRFFAMAAIGWWIIMGVVLYNIAFLLYGAMSGISSIIIIVCGLMMYILGLISIIMFNIEVWRD